MTKGIGTIIFCLPTAILGPLFYRYLENDKVTSLRLSKGSFDTHVKTSPEGKQELRSIDNIEKSIIFAHKLS